MGTGGLIVREGIEIGPWREGGTGGDSSSPTQPAIFPHYLEGGTPNVLGIAAVPGELFYPQTERNANANIPAESQEVNAGVRTQSDVSPCTGPGAKPYP